MATKRLQVYQCGVCGNIVEVVHESGGQLTCCKQPMNLLEENTVDAATEKHIPVVEKVDGGFKVSVGSVAHPMADDHYIEWIQVVADGKVFATVANSHSLVALDAENGRFIWEQYEKGGPATGL